MSAPNMFVRAATVGLFAACAGGSWAASLEEAELSLSYGDSDFISLATGVAEPLSKAPAVATVITADDIRRMGAVDLSAVLETVPGLHVALSSYRFSPIYSMRGIHTDKNPQVLVLINGTPITQAFGGDRGVNFDLPVESIRRIEVIRGPGSAVYGADAFAGVIDITTKSAADYSGLETGVRLGSFRSAAAWGMYGTRVDGLDVSLAVEGSTTDGDTGRRAASDAQTVFDQIFGTSASLAPGSFSTGGKRVDTRLDVSAKRWFARFWNQHQNDFGVGPGLTQALDPAGHAEVDNYLFEAGLLPQALSEHWSGELRLSYMDVNTQSRQTLFPAGTVLPIGSDGNLNVVSPVGLVLFSDGVIGNPEVYEEHLRLEAVAFYRGLRGHTWRFGSGAYYTAVSAAESKNYGPGVIDGSISPIGGAVTEVTGTAFTFMPDESRTVRHVSLQDQWSFAADWDLTAGVRYDRYSDFGGTVNPRLALVWNTRQDLTTKLLYGRAFRAPSFAELFTINNPVVLGNPDLQPETINTYELAFDYRPDFETRVGLGFFTYKIEDLIEFVPNAARTSATAENTDGQDGRGLELELERELSAAMDVRAHYAYQKSTDLGTDMQAAFSPEHQAYAQLRWRPVDLWEVSAQASWIGERAREAGDPRDPLEAYTVVDGVLTRAAADGQWSMQFAVTNLFDTDAREPSPAEPAVPSGSLMPGDYPLAGRGLFVTGRMAF